MKTRPSITSIVKKVTMLIALLFFGFKLSAQCPPYKIPTIPELSDFSKIIYIDPTKSNGNGTINSPYNTLQGLTIQSNTAYLIKSGTKLNERITKVWSNNYISTYGGTERATISGGFTIKEQTNGLTVNYLNVEAPGKPGGTASAIFYIVDVGSTIPQNITVANSNITGVYNSSSTADKWPRNAFVGRANNVTVFNNKIGNSGSKMFFLHGHNFTLVRNYIYNANRSAWNGEAYDESNGVGNGNGFDFRFQRNNTYVAGNYFDIARDFKYRTDCYWKSTIYLTAGWDNPPSNIILEYNTIISPPRDLTGNGALHYDAPPQTIVRKNIIDASMQGKNRGKTPIVGKNFPYHFDQSSPYGIRDNYIIKASSSDKAIWPESYEPLVAKYNNKIFSDWSAFTTDANRHEYGSDIDPNNFWVDLCGTTASHNIQFDVKDEAGVAIANATITLGTATNPQGGYVFTGVAPGTYNYKVEAAGYTTVSASVTADASKTVAVKMVKAAAATYTVNFNVTNSSGVALTNAVVTFAGKTNAAGNYSFSAIAAGTYEYQVAATGYVTSDKKSVSITQNTTIPVQLTTATATTYTVTFKVQDNNGVALNDAVVTFNGKTNPRGNYSFTGIAQGTYSYSVEATGYQVASSASVSVTQNQEFVVKLNPAATETFSVSFVVISMKDDKPVTNAQITLGNKTNISGDYVFHNVSSGRQVFTVEAPGYTTLTDEIADVMMNITVPVYLSKPNNNVVKINAKSEPAGIAFISGAGEYSYEEEVNINVSPVESDFKFIGWKENNTIVSTDENYQFTASTDREIVASFEYSPSYYNVTLATTNQTAVTLSGDGRFAKGEMATVEASLKSGATFKGWANKSGQVVSRQNPYTFEVLRNTSLTAIVEDSGELTEEKPVSVYPNPGNGRLNIVNLWNSEMNVRVINSYGSVVDTRVLGASETVLDLQMLPPGFYFIHFEYNNETVVEKVLFR